MSFNIRSWKVSYYLNDQKRWMTGQLTCTAIDVQFLKDQSVEQPNAGAEGAVGVEDNPTSEPKPFLQLQYSEIKQVQKASSMLVYAAVTVETRDGRVHWFSSMPDRHSVYNMLHHFARQSLTGESTAQVTVVDPAHKTRMGQQLLRSVEDSERTLAGAASDLWHQGRQLANASITVQDMHEDLDVANRLLSGLDSWLGRWHLPPQYKPADAVHISKDDVPCEQDHEVLCSVMSKSQWHPQQICILRTAKTGIAILDMHQRPLHSMPYVELSRVFVVSPWEVVLTKHMVGRADFSVSVVGAALLPVLQLLQARMPHLVDYQTPPETVPALVTGAKSQSGKDRRTQQKSHGQRQASDVHQSGARTMVAGEKSYMTIVGKDELSAQGELQAQQSKQDEGVSDAELRALSSHLGGLKMLALSVGEEVTNQNVALDELTATVDHADSRIQDATRRMKRLM